MLFAICLLLLSTSVWSAERIHGKTSTRHWPAERRATNKAPSIQETLEAFEADTVWIVELDGADDVAALNDKRRRGLDVSGVKSMV